MRSDASPGKLFQLPLHQVLESSCGLAYAAQPAPQSFRERAEFCGVRVHSATIKERLRGTTTLTADKMVPGTRSKRG